MSVFAIALATLHADPNQAVDALFRRLADAEWLPLRVTMSTPDDVMGGARGLAHVVRINAADIVGGVPRRNDLIAIGAEAWKIESAELDALRLSYLCTLAVFNPTTGSFAIGVSAIGGPDTIG